MNACPYCGRSWDQHVTRCEAGVPQVDLRDDRGLAGKVISGYSILGGIGKGGMGTVYLALDNITEGQLDAVKILNRDLLADRERLRREAVTANRVDHPNVCRIYNYVEAYDAESSTALTLIAMELVRGPTLREIQEERGGILELSRAALVVQEVASALTAIHSQNIVHRDIKPTNIIITREPDQPERVKIVDFGIAKAVGGGAGQDLTEPGFVAATVHYASPELLRGRPEKRSDVYALGVVLYEILTGRRPFEATNQAELFSMILDANVIPPTLAEVRPDLGYPDSVQKVLDRALERDPDRRYPSAVEFSEALLGLVPQLAETVRVSISDLPPEPDDGPVREPDSGVPAAPVSATEAISPSAPPAAPSPPSAGPVTPASPGPPGAGMSGEQGGGFSWRSPVVLWGGGSVGALVLAVVLFLALGGPDWFSGSAGGSGDGVVSIRPVSASLQSGETLELTASAEGREVASSEVRWVSRAPQVALVDDDGTVTAARTGTVRILAILDGDSAVATVQVAPGPAARITLEPLSLTLSPGETERVSATVSDAQDNPIQDAGVSWSSSASGVASVDEAGTVRGRAPGSAVIRADFREAWNQVSVQVQGPRTDPGRDEPAVPTCPDPILDVLDRLELALDDPAISTPSVRSGALACWNRGEVLTRSEQAYAAWLLGLTTVEMDGCSQEAILWLDRAVELEPESEGYRVARRQCGGIAP